MTRREKRHVKVFFDRLLLVAGREGLRTVRIESNLRLQVII